MCECVFAHACECARASECVCVCVYISLSLAVCARGCACGCMCVRDGLSLRAPAHPARTACTVWQRDLRADEPLAVVARGSGGADDELIAAPREPGPRLMIAGDPSRLESSGSARAREQRECFDAHGTTRSRPLQYMCMAC